jgi:hypothetical protein
MGLRHSADHLARPHAAVTARATPPTPEDVAMPIVDTQLGEGSTDYLQTCLLAAELPYAHTINFP